MSSPMNKTKALEKRLCKHCKQPFKDHSAFLAYCKRSPTKRSFSGFSPQDNLDYLLGKFESKDTK